ncbi:hypothetical protein [Streptomyces sp. NPDC058155]|uniref:hypothetical protein n=1 Tax=Streptomyces sp. NPDC058155 TaxID=3346359 RepID=UPI0036E9E6B3
MSTSSQNPSPENPSAARDAVYRALRGACYSPEEATALLDAFHTEALSKAADLLDDLRFEGSAQVRYLATSYTVTIPAEMQRANGNPVFVGPPPTLPAPPAAKALDHAAVAAALKAKPGQWAVVKVVASEKAGRVLAGHIRTGKSVAYMRDSFEAEYRNVDDEHRVYARYVGEGGA